MAVTFTAGVEKIFHPDARIGFLAQAQMLAEKTPALQKALDSANAAGDVTAIDAAQKALHANRTLRFNNLLDAAVAGIFLALVTAIVLLSLREWFLLLSRRKPAVLHETEPVWLPDYAVVEGGTQVQWRGRRRRTGAGAGEGMVRRIASGTRAAAADAGDLQCHCANAQQIYVEATEQRFNGVRRCCSI